MTAIRAQRFRGRAGDVAYGADGELTRASSLDVLQFGAGAPGALTRVGTVTVRRGNASLADGGAADGEHRRRQRLGGRLARARRHRRHDERQQRERRSGRDQKWQQEGADRRAFADAVQRATGGRAGGACIDGGGAPSRRTNSSPICVACCTSLKLGPHAIWMSCTVCSLGVCRSGRGWSAFFHVSCEPGNWRPCEAPFHDSRSGGKERPAIVLGCASLQQWMG